MRELYVGSITKRLVGVKCPHCGRSAEGGTSIDDKAASKEPKPGDYSVCLYCGTLNRYTERLGLRKVDRTERRKLARDPRLAELTSIIERVAAAKRKEWQ